MTFNIRDFPTREAQWVAALKALRVAWVAAHPDITRT